MDNRNIVTVHECSGTKSRMFLRLLHANAAEHLHVYSFLYFLTLAGGKISMMQNTREVLENSKRYFRPAYILANSSWMFVSIINGF